MKQIENLNLFKAKPGDKLIKFDREDREYSELTIKKISGKGTNSLFISFEEKEEDIFFQNFNEKEFVSAIGSKYRVVAKNKETILNWLKR